MNSNSLRSRLQTIVALAHLLQCVEDGAARASAEGYRQLVLRLQDALSEDFPADALLAVLDMYPTASQVFENLHYEHSGLFRAPLERSVSSELLARQVLARVARAARNA